MAELTLADKIAQEVVARILPHIEVVRNLHVSGDPASRNGNKVLPKRLLTIKEAAAYLGRSVSAVYHLVSRREIACVRHGRNLRFDIRELDRWIKKGKATTSRPLRKRRGGAHECAGL